MSEPTDDDLSIAIRLTRKDLKRDIAEAEKDLKHFMERWQQEMAKTDKASAELTKMKRPGSGATQKEITMKAHEVGRFTEQVKLQDRYIKTLEQTLKINRMNYDTIRATNTVIKQGVISAKEHVDVIKSMDQGEKNLLKTTEKRVKKQEADRRKKKKAADEASKTWFDRFKQRFRLYTVMSSRGARMIATMRGAAGAALGALGVVGQFALQTIQQGIQSLMKYERLALQFAFTQAGQGVGFGGAYDVAYGGLTSQRGMGKDWAQVGLGREEGAQLQLMNLKSDLNFTKEQLTRIGLSSKLAGEEAGSYFSNLINWMRLFRVESKDYDETIAMFAMMSGQVMGGSGALTEGLDYIAGAALEAEWDPRSFMVIMEEVEESHHDASRFMRGFTAVLSKLIKDNTVLDDSVRDGTGSLRSLDEVIWALNKGYREHKGYVDSSAWAFAKFGDRGAEVINVLGSLIDEGHDFSIIMGKVNEIQEIANDTMTEAEETMDETFLVTMKELDLAIEDFQMTIAKTIAPALKEFLIALTAVINFVTDLTDPGSAINEQKKDIIASQRERLEAYDWETLGAAGKAMSEKGIFQNMGLNKTIAGWTAQFVAERFGRPEAYGGDDDDEEESSPAIRGGSGGRIANSIRKSSSRVTHNYITVMDNDSMIRGLLGANINV